VGFQKLADNIVVLLLPEEPQLNREIKNLNEAVSGGDRHSAQLGRGNCHVIISFSGVEIVNSASLSSLIILRDLLNKHNRRLILCSVSFPTRCIFKVVGLEGLFEFSEDKATALASLESGNAPADSSAPRQ